MDVVHLTAEGERWDQLAMRYYGTPYAYEPIIAANPGIAVTAVLPGGLRLRIPAAAPAVASAALPEGASPSQPVLRFGLPPWKQAP